MNLSSALQFLLLCSLFENIYSKNQDFVDNDSNPDEPSLAGTPNHPYVGIPIGTWKITDLSPEEKETLCQQQEKFCFTECGDESSVKKKNTMGWICTCQNHVPDVPSYKWPVAVSECHGRVTSCSNGCSYGSTKEICHKACNRYFKCDQVGGPQSGLRIEKENQVPKYSLPAGSTNASSSSSSPSFATMKYHFASIFIIFLIFNTIM